MKPFPHPEWQQIPYVSTHIGSLLPIEPIPRPGLQLLPDMSTHIGRLLPGPGLRRLPTGPASGTHGSSDIGSAHVGLWLP